MIRIIIIICVLGWANGRSLASFPMPFDRFLTDFDRFLTDFWHSLRILQILSGFLDSFMMCNSNHYQSSD